MSFLDTKVGNACYVQLIADIGQIEYLFSVKEIPTTHPSWCQKIIYILDSFQNVLQTEYLELRNACNQQKSLEQQL